MPVSATTWRRLGAVSGILFVVLTFATFFTPSTPDADEPAAEIARTIADDRDAHIANFYISGIAWILFVVFVALIWDVLRRSEDDSRASAIALLGGLGVYAGVLVEQSAFLAVVNAADAGREPVAVRALYEFEEVVLVPLRFALAVFFLGIALAAIPTRALPRWLGWTAAALAALLVVGLLGVFSANEDDGPLVPILVLGRIGALVWILAASVVLIRRSPRSLRGA
jgi:Domain of unknown function (DUF4386)